ERVPAHLRGILHLGNHGWLPDTRSAVNAGWQAMTRTIRRRPGVRPVPAALSGRARDVPPATTLSFDYAATFELTGRPGNTVQSVINISPDGVFVATAIGYGFEERRERPVGVSPAAGPPLLPTPTGSLTLGQFPQMALIDGLRISPRFESVALTPEDPRRPR